MTKWGKLQNHSFHSHCEIYQLITINEREFNSRQSRGIRLNSGSVPYKDYTKISESRKKKTEAGS